jgi:predicted PurR-regulated permease PerM
MVASSRQKDGNAMENENIKEQEQEKTPNTDTARADTARAMEVSIRLALVVGMGVWCFEILRPFISTIVWALIIAAALHPAYKWLLKKFRKSEGLTAFIFTAAILAALMTPVLMLSGTLVGTAQDYAADLEDGSLKVPPPPAKVAEWPVIGEPLYDTWLAASQNLEATLRKFEDQLKSAGQWLLATAAGAGLGILQFAAALVVSGIFLAHAEGGGQFARDLGRRLAGPRGESVVNTASSTVLSVARGVLGVAIIQAVAAGMGLMIMDVPGAGLWTLLVLILATVQLPTGLVLIPSIFYVASVAGTVPTVIYAIWMIMVSFSDNILKPLLLGRGSTAPMAVIFLGAIGGFILSGIVGLFVGAVVLVISYKMFWLWFYADRPDKLPEEFS